MILTEEQINYISTNLKFYGVANEELRGDLLDHICTHIESANHNDFDTAYQEALQKFGGYASMSKIERDTYLLVAFKNKRRRQKLMYISGFIGSSAMGWGTMFKVMHWPYASIILFSGFLIMACCFLPLFFYQRYKTFYDRSMAE